MATVVALTAGSLVTFEPGAAVAVATYTPIDLGTLGGTSSHPMVVNDSGQVVGFSATASGQTHAFSWTSAGGMVDLGTLGGSSSYANALSDSGRVVGESATASGQTHAFSWTSAGGMVDLGTFGGSYSFATGVSDSGQVVGGSQTASGEYRAFSWTSAGGMVDLGTFGGSFSDANAVSDSGQVVGSSQTASGQYRAFSWTSAGGMVDLGTVGLSYSEAIAVSDSGQVVGDSIASGYFRAFSWTSAGGMVGLGTLGGSSSWAIAVSDSGQAVGKSTTASGDTHAFSWTSAGGMVDLGTFGGPESFATRVNDSGQVVGESVTASGQARAFSWTSAGGMVDLGTLGGSYSSATGVNASGQVVGTSITASGEAHAVLWEATERYGNTVELAGIGPSGQSPDGYSSLQDVTATGDVLFTSTSRSFQDDSNSANFARLYLGSRWNSTAITPVVGFSVERAGVSDNGRWVAFVLAPDIVLYDTVDQTTTHVVTVGAYYQNMQTSRIDVSEDGRYIVFDTIAALDAADTNGVVDVYRVDRQEGSLDWVSINFDGSVPDGASSFPRMIPSGREVVFTSEATNLILDDTNGTRDAFWWAEPEWLDPDNPPAHGYLYRVSTVGGYGQLAAGSGSMVDISDDGRYVVFDTADTAMSPAPWSSVIRKDLYTGAIELASRGYREYDAQSRNATISADGWVVAFESDWTRATTGQFGTYTDVVVKDFNSGVLDLASVSLSGGEANHQASDPVIAPNGASLAFSSYATDLIASTPVLEAGGTGVNVYRTNRAPHPLPVTRYEGPTGQTNFANATAAETIDIIDFDGDGLSDGQDLSTTYAAQGVTTTGLSARYTTDFTHSPPFGAEASGYNTPAFTGDFTIELAEPASSVSFWTDDEADIVVRAVLSPDGGQPGLNNDIEQTVSFPIGRRASNGSGFYGFTAPKNQITRIIVDSPDNLFILDDLHIGRKVDASGPTILITSPADGATYTQGDAVNARWTCEDDTDPSPTCVAPSFAVYYGYPVDTSTAGPKSFTVTSTDRHGNTTSVTHNYTIAPNDSVLPEAVINTPVDGAIFDLGSTVAADYACTDNVALAATDPCVGTVPVGSNIDTSVIGPHSFSVTATDAVGLATTTSSLYTVSGTLAAGLALTGTFTSIPVGYTVTAVDAGADGVTITIAGTGTEKVVMSVCAGFTVRIAPGSTVTLACGSVTANVAAGSVEVELSSAGSVVAMTVLQGGIATLKNNGDVVVALESAVPVSVTIDGMTQSVAPGGTSDSLAPTAVPSIAPLPNAAGWNKTNVTVSWNWSDETGGSGIDIAHCTTSSVSTGEGAGIVVSAGCSDLAGHAATASIPVKVDRTPPVLVCPASPKRGLNAVGSTLTAAVLDEGGSGVASPSVTVAAPTSVAGNRSVTVTAADVAGNTTSVSCGYQVIYTVQWLIPAGGTASPKSVPRNTVVPFTFRLLDAKGAAVTSAVVSAPTSTVIACPSGATPPQGISVTGNAGTRNLGSGWWLAGWKAEIAWKGTCRSIKIGLSDGTTIAAIYKVV
jgi:probable HAF family extracellular repeat protein